MAKEQQIMSQEELESDKFYVGKVVWVEEGPYPFPARIIEPEARDDLRLVKDNFLVHLFGYNNRKWVSKTCILPYEDKVIHLDNIKNPDYMNAIKEARNFHNGMSEDSDGSVHSTDDNYTMKYVRKSPRKNTKYEYSDAHVRKHSEKPVETWKINCLSEFRIPKVKRKIYHNTIWKSIREKKWHLKRDSIRNFPKFSVWLTKLPIESEFFTKGGELKKLQEDDNFEHYSLSYNVDLKKLKFGMLGWGHQGKDIATFLLKTGQEVYIYNDTSLLWTEPSGATMCNSPVNLVKSCDIIFCCLTNAVVMKKVICNENFYKSINKDKGVIFVTPMNYNDALVLEELISSCNSRYLEISFIQSDPSSNSRTLLAAGHLSFFDVMKIHLSGIVNSILWLGSPGSVIKMNLVQNLMAGTILVGLSEVLAVARCLRFLNTSSWDSIVNILKALKLNNSTLIQGGKAMMSEDASFPVSISNVQPLLHYTLKEASQNSLYLPVATAANTALRADAYSKSRTSVRRLF